MKKTILTIVCCAYLISSLAQTSVGIKIGGNTNYAQLSGISDNFLPDVTSYTGMSAGVDADIILDQKFSFRPGLTYSEKGFLLNKSTDINLAGVDLPVGLKAQFKINYLDIAGLLQFNHKSENGFHAYLFAGPYLGYATNGYVQTKASLLIDVNVKRIDLNLSSNNYNRYELGIAGGGGIGGKVGNGELFLDVKYQHGFTDQVKDPIIDLGVKNRSINFGVGYRFTI